MTCTALYSITSRTKVGLANGSTPQAEDSPEVTIANLQAVLDSTSEELEQQRRLNQALIKRNVSAHCHGNPVIVLQVSACVWLQVFKESQLGESAHKPHHKCIKS